MNAREDEETQQNETTPLLSDVSSPRTAGQRPAIMPEVRRLQDHLPTICEVDGLGQPEQTAFAILVYLYLYQSCHGASVECVRGHSNIWPCVRDAANKGKLAEERSLDIWARYLDTHPSLPEIQSVLWLKFRLEPNSTASSCVADCLHADHAPSALITHSIIQAVMISTWKYGLRGGSHHLLRRFDSLITPRALHLLHILIQLAFVGVLAHYLLYPPVVFISLGQNEQGTRESFLTTMAAASILVPWTLYSFAYLIVFLAFFLTLPSVPLPGSLTFTSLHIAFILLVLSLHLPESPSLALLLRPNATLPLSTLLVQSATRIILPAMLFFLPAFLLSSFLVSASLEDSPINVFQSSRVTPTPMDTRVWFLIFLTFVTMAMFSSMGMGYLAAHTSSLVSAEPWDRYSQAVGLLARKVFYRAVVRYTGHTFFPPFNLLHVFITIPSFCLSFLGYPPIPGMKTLESIMWRSTIGLLGTVTAGFWLWGLI